MALFQAIPKNPKMDLILRQAAELGLHEAYPFFSEYSVPRKKGANLICREGEILSTGNEQNTPGVQKGIAKTDRWQRIVREALQQSGSPVPTLLHEPCSFSDLLAAWESINARHPGAAGILLHHEWLAEGSFHHLLKSAPEFIAMAVGPEGGFSPVEVERFLAAGFKPLLMGNTVLRVETAALYGAASIRTILLERSWWMPNPP
jgi:16S rRNA (uracil1498-N3)-methyltransferase